MEQYHRGVKFGSLAIQAAIFKSASGARHPKCSDEKVADSVRACIGDFWEKSPMNPKTFMEKE